MAATLKPVYLIYGDEFQVDQALRRLKTRIAAEAGGGEQAAAGGQGAATGAENKPAATVASVADARLDVKEFDAAGKSVNTNPSAGRSAGASTGRTAGAAGGVALEAVRAAETLPFFAVTNLVVLRNVDKLKTDDQHLLAEYAANPSPATVLVMTAGKMAKSSVLYKATDKTGQVHEFATPKGSELAKWVAEEFKTQGQDVDAATVLYLINRVGTDQATLHQEVMKLVAYAGADGRVDEPAVDAVGARNPETNIWALVDNLGHRRADDAIVELNRLLADGEPAQRIMSMIVRQYRILLKAKSLDTAKAANTAAYLGVAPFVVDKYKTQARRYSLPELRQVYCLLKDADIAMKTGQQEPRLALEILIGKIAAP